MSKVTTLALFMLGSLALLSVPATARGGHHHGHGYGHRGGHHGAHHGHHSGYHGRPRHHASCHRGHGWRGPEAIYRGGRTVFVGRPYPVFVRPVIVSRPYAVYPRPVRMDGYRPGCSTTRRVGITAWGWRKVVTTRTCIVP